MQSEYDEKVTSVIKPPVGYDYSPPEGYKASENPTFPKSLYEAAEEILIITPTTESNYLPPSSTYKNPDVNPTFPKKFYEEPHAPDSGYVTPQYGPPHVKHDTGYKPPKGYDYSPPSGYSADENPTFPKYESKHAVHKDGYHAPAGYDYKPPTGYDPDNNPTFPKKKYFPPKPPAKTLGLDYKAPDGFSAERNPTFPDYSPPKEYGPPKPDYVAPSEDYGPPKPGYIEPAEDYGPPKPDYKPPSEYGPPKPDYNPPSKEYGPATEEYSKPSEDYGPPTPDYKPPSPGYKPPAGYNYPPPDGYSPDVNPTFPKHKLHKKKGSTHAKHHEISSLYDTPLEHHKDHESGYKYSPPEGYSASDNPTFPRKHHKTENIAALLTGYQAPGDNYHEEHSEHPPEKSYLPPPNYPQHKFNIIIKNKNKPDTSISITPEPHLLSVTHGAPHVSKSLNYNNYNNKVPNQVCLEQML